VFRQIDSEIVLIWHISPDIKLAIVLILYLKFSSSSPEVDVILLIIHQIAFFPFAISMDSWRWEVYEGKTTPEQYNTRWWELRTANQGIVPPSSRDAASFDPAAKYHIVANVEYLRSEISNILLEIKVEVSFSEHVVTAHCNGPL